MPQSTDNIRLMLEGIRDERNLHANTATRVGQALLALLSLMTDGMQDLYLRKDVDETTRGLMHLLAGATFGTDYAIDAAGMATLKEVVARELRSPDFVSGLMSGLGWRMTEDGVLECNGIRVRNTAEFQQLIINRIRAMEGDIILSDTDTIETVTPVHYDDGTVTYQLKLRDKWQGYYTAQVVGNVLKGIVNTLEEGNGTYHTSWSRVLSVDLAHNTVEVVMYPDSEVPGGKNFPPSAMMNVARWGNPIDSTRQSCIYLSSTEGRIVKLTKVTKPIIDEGNYGFVIGDLPEFIKSNTALPIRAGLDYVYVAGVVAQDIITMPYQGKPMPTYVDRGTWTATPEEPYHCETRNSTTGVYETSDVWHYGCKWRCLADGTTDEPRWNSDGWGMIEGNPAFHIEIDSSNGETFDPDHFDTVLTVIGWMYNQNVTDDLLDGDVVWTRTSKYPDGQPRTEADMAWNNTHAPSKSVHLTVADIGVDSAGVPLSLIFTATALLRDGQSASYSLGY